ncbi:MAG: hypothetical protein KA717_09415 [Woronichinia naegeliana WA131]|jgi:hypothetical protein|uniref:RiboL-PSP-HEPN domain-containing protein n=1 Tax=Woronichinia naegeliana WA131 TaxID=2824559 RepID=A0A977KZQ6_9CYAN|nr:MAG: hypothetical protein KA717_09415 [Woronichinia naegeliana WA131]
MTNSEDIKNSLEDLKGLYESVLTSELPSDLQTRRLQFYSKLAILELCAWIEEAQDEIILDYIQLNLLEGSNIESVRNMVRRNPSFDYEKFRAFLIHIIGIISVERLEAKLKQQQDILQRIKSELGALQKKRNDLAHTHLKEITPSYDAPSVTYNNFLKIYDLLQKIESDLNTL